MVNKATLDLIKNFEGLRLKAYVDPGTGGEPHTIGFGTTIYKGVKKVRLGDVVTEAQAYEFLSWDVNKFAERVKSLIKKPLTDNQFGALVSFAYNIGVGGLGGSTLLKKVNLNPKDSSITAEFLRWNKAGGKIMAGLTRRRVAEAALYTKL